MHGVKPMGFEFSRTRPRHFQTFPLGQFSTMSAWAKLKVAELKDELKQRGLAVAGKKAELVARLEEYESEMRQATEPEPPSKKQKKASPEPSKPSKQAPVPPATKPEGLVDDDDDDDRGNADRAADDELVALAEQNKPVPVNNTSCPYLSTINRKLLDFDFEKACSVSLSKHNVYACLTCGKFFNGRAPSTNAYTHALQEEHNLFMRLDTGRTYCLPDNYEVVDPTLHDIQHVLNPNFSPQDIASVDTRGWSRDLEGKEYMPGLVGLNNMKHNDYANVVLQALFRVAPIRDFFLERKNYADVSTPLLERFGELVRKTNNDRAFRGHVSPHDFMQSVMAKSGNKFSIETQGDPVQFFSWLLNALHKDLTGGNPKQASVVSDALQGEIEVTTLAGTGSARKSATDVVQRVPYLMLTLDLPPAPLFKDAMEKIVIPQIPIGNLLTKFDGVTVQDDVRLGRRKMRLLSLPRFLAVSVKRFVKNQFFMEKNPTIVNFPAKGLEMQSAAGTASYDLIANVMHEHDVGEGVGGSGGGGGKEMREGTFKAHIHRKNEDCWYEVQDLMLTDVIPQVVVLSETTLLLYERNYM